MPNGMPRPPRALALAAAALLLSCSGDAASKGAAPNAEGWWRDRVGYEVFVRSFADSNGDGIGDLAGLTARLDALNDGDPTTTSDLGVTLLWLMPVFPTPSYHGYDVTDYRAINPQYGTLSDFDAFLAAAHRRGVKVILDMVLNHSSSQHPWFQDSRSGPTAAKRAWYSWRADDPGWLQPWGSGHVWHPSGGAYYYGIFWSEMPDLALENPAVEDELVGAMQFWLDRGVDGFRLDAIRHYVESPTGDLSDQPGSHAFLRRIRARLEASHPNTLLVGEAWTSLETVATYWGTGDEVQAAFAFDEADALRAAATSGTAAPLVNVVARTEAALAGKDRGFDAPFLTNHDQVRVMQQLGGDAGAARVAAAALFALPGTPFVYYGEEVGMQGGVGTDDRLKRTPMRWSSTPPGYGFSTVAGWTTAPEASGVEVAAQQADPASLWNLYRRLIGLRQGRSALATGDAARPAVAGGGDGLFALVRQGPGGRVLALANFATTETGSFTVEVTGTPAVLEAEGLVGAPAAGATTLTVPGLAARGFAFLSLD
jgi:glycosidase